MTTKLFFLFSLSFHSLYVGAQTNITIYIDSIQAPIGNAFQPGVFYVPKTAEAQTDFLNNGIRQNAIRLNIIEGALNNNSDLIGSLAYLDNVTTILQDLAAKTDNLLFIFEKMPAWLSSSSDGSPAGTPGWAVLHTKPPANWNAWTSMVIAVTDRIVNTYGISNAQFEIWNEPDLGSWTGTKAEYFELYQKTYDAIKSVNGNLQVGGPATNYWGKNINYQQPYGYLTAAIGDSSLIGELIDSSTTWNKPLDFISWHNFNITYQTNANAIDYITQKYQGLGLSIPKLMVSEWNTPSQIRETPLHKSFFIKSLLATAHLPIDYNMVAAWQDFEQDPVEFHADYGLLTYGAIHKPVYKAILLAHELNGQEIKTSVSAPIDLITTISHDTLSVLITNYIPPPFVEALNATLYDGKFIINQLDSAGFLDVLGGNIDPLDSIYQGLSTISNSNPLEVAINNAISVYSHYDSLQNVDRHLEFNVTGLSGIHHGWVNRIDSTTNNSQFEYNSLIGQGFSQQAAITSVMADQSLNADSVALVHGQLGLSMQPNSVFLFQFIVPELLNIMNDMPNKSINVFPNPTSNHFTIRSATSIGDGQLIDLSGKVLYVFSSKESELFIDLSNYSPGFYCLILKDLNEVMRIIKY